MVTAQLGFVTQAIFYAAREVLLKSKPEMIKEGGKNINKQYLNKITRSKFTNYFWNLILY